MWHCRELMKCGIKSGRPLTVFVSSLWIPKKFQPFQNCNKCGKVLHFNWNHILYYSSIVNCFNDYTYTYTAFSIWWHVDGSYPSESGTNSLLRIHRKCFEHFLMSLIFCFWHADCFLFTVAFSIMNIYSIQSLPTETYNWCVREKNHKHF